MVDWFLEGRGGRTVLRLVHSGFGHDARWDEEYEGTRRGWSFELESLKHYLERHAGQRRRAFWLRRKVDDDAQRVWQRLAGPGGFVETGDLAGLSPGDPYDVVLASGDRLTGSVRLNVPPTDFAGTSKTHNDGLFRFAFETSLGQPEAHVWLSVWDATPAEIGKLEGRFQHALDKCFA
jgi:hypothetical protein